MRKLLHYFVPVMLAALAPVYADAGVPLHESADVTVINRI